MSKDFSEYIDDYCEDNYGHTNWAYLNTLTKEELEANKDKGDIDKLNNLFFYYEDDSNNLQIEAMLDWYDSSLISGIPFMLMMTK